MSQIQIDCFNFIIEMVEILIPAAVAAAVSLLLVKVFKTFLKG